MELFAKLFDSLLVFVYHCFDRIVIHGYLGARRGAALRRGGRGRTVSQRLRAAVAGRIAALPVPTG